MAVIRVEKTKDYTTMCNEHLKDKKLSLKAKGLLSMMLSLPDEWHYSVKGLKGICQESINAINGVLNELEKNNYLIRNRKYCDGKISEWEYIIFETKEQKDLYLKNLYLQNEDIRNEDIRNEDVYKDTNQSSTNKSNTNGASTNGYDMRVLGKIESEFETIWKIYKKKVDKDKALKAYKKARKDHETTDHTKYKAVDYETILNGVKRYNEYLEAKNTDMQYVKMFSTWLNGRCWENDYIIEKSKNNWTFMDL